MCQKTSLGSIYDSYFERKLEQWKKASEEQKYAKYPTLKRIGNFYPKKCYE